MQNTNNRKSKNKTLNHKISRKNTIPKRKQDILPAFVFFTKKQANFIKLAKELTTILQKHYGEEVSISKFEKLFVSIQTLSPDKKALLDITKIEIMLLKEYRKARDERNSERSSFRSDVKIADIDGGMDTFMSTLPESGN
jgi:hypothetical protein